MFFSIRSEPMLLEQLRYNLLFRWVVGLSMDDRVWDVSTFSKNRRRFLEGEIAHQFLRRYDTADFVERLRELITPHVAQNMRSRRSAIDQRTTRHRGYQVSQRRRKLVEESFGWAKTMSGLRKVHVRGLDLVGDVVRWTAAAYNLTRIRNLGACT